MYNDYGCSNEGASQFFNRIDENNDNQLSVSEFKKAWEYFEGLDCEYGEEGGDGEGSNGGSD